MKHIYAVVCECKYTKRVIIQDFAYIADEKEAEKVAEFLKKDCKVNDSYVIPLTLYDNFEEFEKEYEENEGDDDE